MECFKRDIWKVHHKILNSSTKFAVNKTVIFETTKIADEFNTFFANIETDLANKIPNASKSYLIFI